MYLIELIFRETPNSTVFFFLSSNIITHLVSPQSTVLDDSIGCALWFAARGRGNLASIESLENRDQHGLSCSSNTYTSPVKVTNLL